VSSDDETEGGTASMIYSVKGRIVYRYPGRTCLEVSPAIVLDVYTPLSYFSNLKNDEIVTFYIVMKIKDEDPQIYGFLSVREKEFFLKMISISGIGSKTALLIISSFSISEFMKMLESSDVVKLSSIPGIGKKTAQRVILELSGKIRFEEEELSEDTRLKNDLVSALVNLGYPQKNVKSIVDAVLRDMEDDQSFESLFKLTLKKISSI
jgi:Holliday junction DNA helicase RuvA